MLVLPRNLAGLAKFASKDSARYAMIGVKVLDKDDGTYEAVATDGRKCLVVRGACPWPEAAQSFDRYEDVCIDFQIPLELWGEAFKSTGDWKALTLQGKGGDFILGHDRGFVDGQQLEGRFPPYRDVFPTHRQPLATIRVNPRLLAELLLYLDKMQPLENGGVNLILWDKSPLLGLAMRNPETKQAFDACLMGLT